MNKTIFVGMSGGVDSSVAAALLKQQGYKVVGVYMKNWSQDLPGMPCTWQEDYQDAKRVAVQLGIEFKVYDFETEYRQKVVDYMLAEYSAGRTPNPDIMCNQEIKFKLFLETALHDGADMIATGHYARVTSRESRVVSHDKTEATHNSLLTTHNSSQLCVAANADKDQTYFLYRVTARALSQTLFPIGEFKTKAEVRLQAQKMGLATASKKDSQGICFVGKVGIKDFLLHELGPQKPGNIIDQLGQNIGKHDGAIFYTIGQRHGLDIGGGLPYYITGKDMAKNEVYVTTNLQDEKLWHRKITLADLHWINESTQNLKAKKHNLQVRLRYRAPLVGCVLDNNLLRFDEPVRAVTPGQSAVFYSDDYILGGGIVC